MTGYVPMVSPTEKTLIPVKQKAVNCSEIEHHQERNSKRKHPARKLNKRALSESVSGGFPKNSPKQRTGSKGALAYDSKRLYKKSLKRKISGMY
ncbi:hypothetical protein [Dethiosulfatarculus sandiegensis]|uniref:Uncharacterized protein n=1 Tax=Dethiosulfatarculus sandiegensis TaxID=1429043 RepID=A0A0D2IZ00_9BACT|nr:hypothetical protein [Dethiosulfatarculus sandiegensis]KIX11244.1 hypothetical protein X474_25810 [Dethiosulfatarculus sandiegensis]